MTLYEFDNLYVLITEHDEYIEEIVVDKNNLDSVEYITDIFEANVEFIHNLYSFYQLVDLLYPKKHILNRDTIGDLISYIVRTFEGINV